MLQRQPFEPDTSCSVAHNHPKFQSLLIMGRAIFAECALMGDLVEHGADGRGKDLGKVNS